MLVELDSSPGAKGEDGGPALTETKSLAPFPDMGMGLGIESAPGDAIANGSEDAPKTETQTAVKTEGLTPGTATGAPATAPETKPSDAGESVPGVSDSGLTFTNMEFSLAAPDNGGQGDQQTGQDQPESFDLTSLTAQAGNGNGNDASNNLDSILPPTSTDQGANSIGENGAPSGDQSQMANGQTDLGVPSFEGLNMENMDFGAADGTDFDFSMDDGNSFDDLMNSHEQNFDAAMDPGQFDADFFELDKTEGA